MMKKSIVIALMAGMCLLSLPACPKHPEKPADKDASEASVVQKNRENAETDKLVPFRENEKWGLKEKTSGKVVIPAKYDEMEVDMGNGFFLVGILDEGRGFLDKTGKEVVPLKYDCVFYETNDGKNSGGHHFTTSFVVSKTDSTGLPVNRYFVDGMAIVGHTEMINGYRTGNANLGYINEAGKEVIPPVYAQAFPFIEGLALVVKQGSGVGFIDKTGKEVIPCKYDSGGFFNEGKAQVKLNGEEFYIDKTGKRLP